MQKYFIMRQLYSTSNEPARNSLWGRFKHTISQDGETNILDIDTETSTDGLQNHVSHPADTAAFRDTETGLGPEAVAALQSGIPRRVQPETWDKAGGCGYF